MLWVLLVWVSLYYSYYEYLCRIILSTVQSHKPKAGMVFPFHGSVYAKKHPCFIYFSITFIQDQTRKTTTIRRGNFPFDFEPMEFHLVQNRKENCYHDHIPFNVKGNVMLVLSVYIITYWKWITDIIALCHYKMKMPIIW